MEGPPDLEVPDLELQCSYEIDEAVECFGLSGDSQSCAIGSLEDKIWVLDAQLKLKHKLSGHSGGVNSLAFAGTNRLVSAGEDGLAAVWDCDSGKALAKLTCEGTDADKTSDGHTVTHVAVNGGGTLAACAAGKTVHLFDPTADDIDASRRVYPAVAKGVVESSRFVQEQRLAVTYYGGIILHGTDPAEPGLELEYPTVVYSAATTPTLSYVVGACMDNCVHIWQMQPMENGDLKILELSCGGYDGKVTAVSFDRDGQLLASLSGARSVIWDFAGAGPAGTVPAFALGHIKAATCQAWQSEAPGLLATGGKDGRVIIYDAHDTIEGRPRLCLPLAMAHTHDEVTCLAWGASQALYSAHKSGTVRKWSIPPEALAGGL